MASIASPPRSPASPHSPTQPTRHNQTSMTGSSSLPPLNTSQTSKRNLQRPPSYAWSRMSTYSTTSRLSERGSRPISQAFPLFHTSLAYALVRDFAYPVAHPNHYGPPPLPSQPPSEASTPVSDRHRLLSDSTNGSWDSANNWGSEGYFSTQQLPQLAYGDGPPYSEDEDLHSPVVKSSRHKKGKSAQSEGSDHDKGGTHEYRDGRRKYLVDVNEDGTKTYYVSNEDENAGGPGGEFISYENNESGDTRAGGQRQARQRSNYNKSRRNHITGEVDDSEEESLGVPDLDDSRYSRDYQFTIASPDEEMHGKAVALFDFESENENELPLTEGQIIWVSYRHGQGWLVAEDPKTGDAGLVPEEYVRLLRDIQGGLGSLDTEEDQAGGEDSPPEGAVEQSPTKIEHTRSNSNSNSHGDKNAAVVSSFSTSSKDLDPYPHPLLGDKSGHPPPQVVHYGSQTNTPTLRSPATIVEGSENAPDEQESSSDESTDTEDKARGKTTR